MLDQLNNIVVNKASEISISIFVFNLILSAILSVILSWVYKYYGKSLSNRSQFSNNFFILTMTTMLIITVVKSSLALSLGLVGALSIIRFRTAVKEPEELAYLFLAISIGLGLGANQTMITIVALLIILCSIIFHHKFFFKPEKHNSMILTIEAENNREDLLDHYTKILINNCDIVDLKRFDINKTNIEASFIIVPLKISSLTDIKNNLYEIDKNVSISFIDNTGHI